MPKLYLLRDTVNLSVREVRGNGASPSLLTIAWNQLDASGAEIPGAYAVLDVDLAEWPDLLDAYCGPPVPAPRSVTDLALEVGKFYGGLITQAELTQTYTPTQQ